MRRAGVQQKGRTPTEAGGGESISWPLTRFGRVGTTGIRGEQRNRRRLKRRGLFESVEHRMLGVERQRGNMCHASSCQISIAQLTGTADTSPATAAGDMSASRLC